ncbi:MAG: GTPase domain-containing protein [Desulfomonile sp.]|nr:GTPase domain-containing protein [Desulfomonile sp.]
MAIIRRKLNEVQCKIVYYGTGLGGKTTNLVMIHRAVGKKVRGELISINTAGDRTIFFDFLPMDLGLVRNMSIKISVYTVPGQVQYNDTRKLVLKGADGVVFVADSQNERRLENIDSLNNLEQNLLAVGCNIDSVPVVLQYNKRDLNGGEGIIMPVAEMERDLNPQNRWRSFEASAINGWGVKESFKQICIETVQAVGKQLFT